MGNRGSTESPATLTPGQQREDNIYEDYVTPALSSVSGGGGGGGGGGRQTSLSSQTSGTPPPVLSRSLGAEQLRSRPHGMERRSMTVVGRTDQQRGDAALRRQSTSDAILSSLTETAGKQDTIKAHIVELSPQRDSKEVELAASVHVTFDREVRSVNHNKLFEVKCDLDLQPIKGYSSFDSRTQRAEFKPFQTLHPGATYTVALSGRAITTAQTQTGGTITATKFSFTTTSPAPKNIGIKLRGQRDVEKLQIDNFYDLYNSLVVWSTKQWGCSSEHIIGMYKEVVGEERGTRQHLKADHDILGLAENDVIVVEIKD